MLINDGDRAEVLAREIARHYEERHQCVLKEVALKQDATEPCPPDQLQRLREVCDFLIISLGDSEESTILVLEDALNFEQLGKPALAVFSRHYRDVAQTLVTKAGLEDYPFIPVAHPVTGLSDEEIGERALYAYRQGMATLTGVFKIKA